MTTNYRLSDSLPKDVSGAKVIAPINDQTSQLDFGMLRGVAAESLGGLSVNTVFLGVASHKAGSALGTKAGVMSIGAYTESPSAIGTGNAQLKRVDKEGALYVRPASGIQTNVSHAASTNIHAVGSALLHDVHVFFSDVNAGDTAVIEDGDNYRLGFVATATSQHFSEHFATGLVFATNIKHTFAFSGAGGGSVTIGYSQY